MKANARVFPLLALMEGMRHQRLEDQFNGFSNPGDVVLADRFSSHREFQLKETDKINLSKAEEKRQRKMQRNLKNARQR